MATNDNTETIYSWPWTTFRSGEKRQKLGWNRKKQTKTKQQKGKQSEPSGRLRRGKGPNPPPQTPARLASLACFLSLFPHCRTCSYFHSTTQHVAVTLIPHKWFTQTLCGCRLFTHLELVSKTTTLHVNNAFFCAFIFHHCTTATWKYLIPRFIEDINKQGRDFLLFLNLDMVVRYSTSGEFDYVWHSKWVRVIALKIEIQRIHFFKPRFHRVAIVGSYGPSIMGTTFGEGCDHALPQQNAGSSQFNKAKLSP